MDPKQESANRGKPTLLVLWIFVIGAVMVVLNENSINVLTTSGRLLYAVLAIALVLSIFLGFYIWWQLETYSKPDHFNGSLSAGLVSLATLTCLLLAAEALARVFPVFDSYGLNPASRFIWPEANLPPNSLGYRDREPGPKTGPRILVLGDSFAVGAGVRRTQRFSSLLENMYRTGKDSNLEVFNAGRSGMDTFDQARILEASGDAVKPDLVVVAYVMNDADGHGLRPRKTQPPAIETFFLREINSYAFYYFYSKGRKRISKVDEDPMLLQHQINAPGWLLSQKSMRDIIHWTQQRNIPAILIALPIFFDYGERYRTTLDQVVQTARLTGFQSRNTIDDFSGRLAELAISSEDPHPGPEAHQIIAESLHRFIGRPWAEENRQN